jgi:hypothetical protein
MIVDYMSSMVFTTWLERIYHNLFVDLWRRGRIVAVDLDAVPELARAGTPEEDILQRERQRLVRDGLRHLSRESRRALLCKYYCDLDERSTATRFGIARATVRTRVYRALAQLRGRLGGLRVFCPPVLGRLWAQALSVGVAPVLVVTMMVAGTSAPVAEPACASPMVGASEVAFRRAVAPAPVRVEAPPVLAQTRSRARVARKVATVVAVPEPAPQPESSEPARDVADVGPILNPDCVDIIVEPARLEAPSMIAPPSDFVAQIEKMIEERL